MKINVAGAGGNVSVQAEFKDGSALSRTAAQHKSYLLSGSLVCCRFACALVYVNVFVYVFVYVYVLSTCHDLVNN